MASDIIQPEVYWTIPNDHCPNSRFPVLVYRNVFPKDVSLENARELFEENSWSYDQCWTQSARAHFHTTTHECYAPLKGHSTWLYGVGPLDNQSEGVVFDLDAGDVAVHAAGVSHMNTKSSEDFIFMAMYPKELPHYDTHESTGDVKETKVKAQHAETVPIPQSDPIYGANGPLRTIWKNADFS